ncbi:hypothetical protein ACFWUZ_03255 [Streptomyces sp. NPDC058646]
MMHYGGNLVEAALATVVAARRYQANGRSRQRRRRRPDGAEVHVP